MDCVAAIVSVAIVECSSLVVSTDDDDSTNGSVLDVLLRNRMNKRLKYNQTIHVHVSENNGRHDWYIFIYRIAGIFRVVKFSL